MNEVQRYIRDLKANGWTHQAIDDEVGVRWNSLRSWEAGTGNPANVKAVELALGMLLDRKPPPKRRYPEGHYMQRAKAERDRESGDQTNKGQGSPGPGDRNRRTRGYCLRYVEMAEGGTSLSIWHW